jgi:hypothetical protein
VRRSQAAILSGKIDSRDAAALIGDSVAAEE